MISLLFLVLDSVTVALPSLLRCQLLYSYTQFLSILLSTIIENILHFLERNQRIVSNRGDNG